MPPLSNASDSAVPDGLADLWSYGWEADFNHTVWKSPAGGMYLPSGRDKTELTGGLPAQNAMTKGEEK